MSKLSDIIPSHRKTIGEVYKWVGPFEKRRVGNIDYREVAIEGEEKEKFSQSCYARLINNMDGELQRLYVLRPVYSKPIVYPKRMVDHEGGDLKAYMPLLESYLKWWANDAPWAHMVLYKKPKKILSHGAIVDIGLARGNGEAKACLIAFRLFYEAHLSTKNRYEFVIACLDIGVTWPMILSVLPNLGHKNGESYFTPYSVFSEHSALSPSITFLDSWLRGDVNTDAPSSHAYCRSYIRRVESGTYISELLELTGYTLKRAGLGGGEHKQGHTLPPSELAEHVLTIQEKYLNAK